MYGHTDTDTDTVGNFHIWLRLYVFSYVRFWPNLVMSNDSHTVLTGEMDVGDLQMVIC